MWCCVIKETQPTDSAFFASYPLVCLPLFGCLQSSCVWSYPPPNNTCVLHCCFTNTSFHSTTLLLNHFTQPPVTQPVLCSLHPTPRHHPCYSPTMSHSKSFSPLTPIIAPTPHDHPRTNLVPWKIAQCSPNEMPSGSCSAYATTRSGLSSTPPLGNS